MKMTFRASILPVASFAAVLVAVNLQFTSAFAPPLKQIHWPQNTRHSTVFIRPRFCPPPKNSKYADQSVSLQLSNVATIPAAVATTAASAVQSMNMPLPSPSTLEAVLVSFALALIVKFRTRIFYPGSSPDPSHLEPLPPGTMGGCPWIGSFSIFTGSTTNNFLSQQAAKVNNARIWKLFTFSKPTAIVSGSDNIKKLLNREFKKGNDGGGAISQITPFGNSDTIEVLFGTESMAFGGGDAKQYHMLQRLVGQALTPDSVAKGMPLLQECAEETVDEILAQKTVVMADILKGFTIDVAWRQIIGLKLSGNEEISAFRSAVKTWLGWLSNFFVCMFPIPSSLMKRLPMYKAKMYLNEKVGERIDQLEREGPDGSTLSGMIYATDEEDGSTKLTRKQVIDNTFLLLVAGSETSSNTLTNAMQLLGMHPDVWKNLVKEQQDYVKKHGDKLSKEDLDEDCPYLDGVIRETMRLLTISGGGVRVVDDTLVMDGLQIPKGWWTMYSPQLTHEQDPKTFLEDGSHMDIRAGFKPERWMDPATRPTSEYLPFGAGHRFCLGHVLAIAEMKTFLAVLARKVQSFDLVTDSANIKWKEGLIVTPKDGVVISAH